MKGLCHYLDGLNINKLSNNLKWGAKWWLNRAILKVRSVKKNLCPKFLSIWTLRLIWKRRRKHSSINLDKKTRNFSLSTTMIMLWALMERKWLKLWTQICVNPFWFKFIWIWQLLIWSLTISAWPTESSRMLSNCLIRSHKFIWEKLRLPWVPDLLQIRT